MKTALLIAITLCFYTILSAQSQEQIGMSKTQFSTLHPQLKSSIYENSETFSIGDTLYGLADEWGFRFENDTLTWMYFNKYIDEITKENFDLCLSATEKIINEYTVIFGQPDTLIVGDKNFIDPYDSWHWGYDVVEARWTNANGKKVKVEFDFFGGKGVFNFIVSINYFEIDYPYFD